MRIQLFLSAILFGCLLEVQSKSFLIETEDAGSKQPDEFAAVRRNLPEGKEFDYEELREKVEQVVTEALMMADDDGDGNDYSGIHNKRRALLPLSPLSREEICRICRAHILPNCSQLC